MHVAFSIYVCVCVCVGLKFTFAAWLTCQIDDVQQLDREPLRDLEREPPRDLDRESLRVRLYDDLQMSDGESLRRRGENDLERDLFGLDAGQKNAIKIRRKYFIVYQLEL